MKKCGYTIYVYRLRTKLDKNDQNMFSKKNSDETFMPMAYRILLIVFEKIRRGIIIIFLTFYFFILYFQILFKIPKLFKNRSVLLLY